MRRRYITLLLALALDWLAGEPPTKLHPVVWLGNLITLLQRRAPHGSPYKELLYGAGMTAFCLGTAALPTLLLERKMERKMVQKGVQKMEQNWSTLAMLYLYASLLKITFAWNTLFQASGRVADALEKGNIDDARTALRWLVSRDTALLDEPMIAAAAIESLAENASDSVVAPLCAFALSGLPGAFAYRAVNTMDAMIGYRGQYEYLGKVPARLDDLLNLLPARFTALCIVVAAGLCGNHTWQAWRVVWHDHKFTASPNAGWPMSAAAGVLGVRLEKVGHYCINKNGRIPTVADIRHAERVVGVALILAAGVVLLATWLRPEGKQYDSSPS